MTRKERHSIPRGSELCAPACKWGCLEWIGLAAAAALGAIYGAPYIFAAWLVVM